MRTIAVGLGSFGRTWAEIIRDSHATSLVAVVDPLPEHRIWAAAALGLPIDRIFATLDEALPAVESDAVVIVTPPSTHLEVAALAMRAGKAVLLEKPLSPTLREASAAIQVADETGRILMVSQNYRYRPAARVIQRLIRDGAIGELVAASVSCQRDLTSAYEATNFRYQMRHPYVIDMSIHHFDLMRALTGLRVNSIHASSWPAPGTPFQHHPSAAALVTFENGAPLIYQGSVATHRPLTSWNGEWEIIGETGRITWDGGIDDAETGNVRLERRSEAPVPVPIETNGPQGRDGVLTLFRQYVTTRVQPETSARDNIESLALVLACAESIDRAAPLDVQRYMSEQC